jgi:DNA invertase Pin-like site-specific DNA recombinase
MQVLGAAAEFESALVRVRPEAGLASARSKGRIGGNPGLRARDPAALRKVRLARQCGGASAAMRFAVVRAPSSES